MKKAAAYLLDLYTAKKLVHDETGQGDSHLPPHINHTPRKAKMREKRVIEEIGPRRKGTGNSRPA